MELAGALPRSEVSEVTSDTSARSQGPWGLGRPRGEKLAAGDGGARRGAEGRGEDGGGPAVPRARGRGAGRRGPGARGRLRGRRGGPEGGGGGAPRWMASWPPGPARGPPTPGGAGARSS